MDRSEKRFEKMESTHTSSTHLSDSQASVELCQALKDFIQALGDKCRSEYEETVEQVNVKFDDSFLHLMEYLKKAYTLREKALISRLNEYKRKHEEISASSATASKKLKQSVEKYRNSHVLLQEALDRNHDEMIREFKQFESDMEDAATRMANERNTIMTKMDRELNRFRELEARLGPEEKGQNQDEIIMSFKALLKKVG